MMAIRLIPVVAWALAGAFALLSFVAFRELLSPRPGRCARPARLPYLHRAAVFPLRRLLPPLNLLRNVLKYVFVILVAWPVMSVWLGLNVRHRDRLPRRGPAIVAANHNSHLDTLALLALFPLSLIPRVRPVAAADYFMRSRAMAWFGQNVVGIVPVERGGHEEGSDPLDACHAALNRGEILIIFPEGTRGEPEHMTELKSGIARLSERHAEAPVVTIFMHGLGKSMPKGSFFPVPFFADIFLGEPFRWTGTRESFMAKLQDMFDRLRAELHAPNYT